MVGSTEADSKSNWRSQHAVMAVHQWIFNPMKTAICCNDQKLAASDFKCNVCCTYFFPWIEKESAALRCSG
jgi:hypothetical protein